MIRVLVIDDNDEQRLKVTQVLSPTGPASPRQMTIVGEARTSDEGLRIARNLSPDLVLQDLHLPGLLDTRDLLQKLCQLKNCRVVMFASQGKAADVQDFLDAGACAYVLKDDPPALLRMSLLLVYKGTRGIISPKLPRNLTRLTTQERQLLRQLTPKGGLRSAADRLGLTREALEQELTYLSSKLEMEDSAKLLKWARKQGF